MTNTTTKVSLRETYDRIVVKVTYPSGGSVELRINRYSEKLLVGGSKDPEIARQQLAVLDAWVKPVGNESHGDRAKRVADLAGRYRSVGELVAQLGGVPVKQEATPT